MKVSACIIAKNEEEMLPRCLESIKGLCDEIVLIDTGSTDKTVEIAEGYGAFVVKTKWQDSFSIHRNQAFDYAKGEWLFVIDCDEELVTENLDSDVFKKRLDMIDPNVTQLVVNVKEKCFGTETKWLGNRFFRASANPKYKYCVHNKIECPGAAAATDIEIIHYGYHLSAEKMMEKRKRTEKLLLKRLHDDPDDYNAYYYLCQMAQGDKRWNDSVKYGRKCLEMLPFENGEEMQYYATLYFWVAAAYMKLNDAGECEAWLNRGLEFFPDDLDLNWLKVFFAYRINDRPMAAEHARRYFKALRKIKKKDTPKAGFENYIDKKDFVTRTIYCIGDRHKNDVLNCMRMFRAAEKA